MKYRYLVIIFDNLNSQLDLELAFQDEQKYNAKGICQYCGHDINSLTEDNICGFCKAYFEETERQNGLRKIYDKFKDVIDYNSDFKEIIDEENKKINNVIGK